MTDRAADLIGYTWKEGGATKADYRVIGFTLDDISTVIVQVVEGGETRRENWNAEDLHRRITRGNLRGIAKRQ